MTTKIVTKRCQDCNEKIMILCSEGSDIVAARCPRCVIDFGERCEEYNKKLKL